MGGRAENRSAEGEVLASGKRYRMTEPAGETRPGAEQADAGPEGAEGGLRGRTSLPLAVLPLRGASAKRGLRLEAP